MRASAHDTSIKFEPCYLFTKRIREFGAKIVSKFLLLAVAVGGATALWSFSFTK